MEFKHTQLANGLTIIAELNPGAASTAVGFLVRTGSRDEVGAVAGVSHFLEHMMFRGTKRRSAFDISREFDEMGALYNAFTSEENTMYWASVLPERQKQLLDLLADMLRPELGQEEFDTEKQVILEEIALYQDQPRHRLFEKLMAEHFGEHPLSNSILGKAESVQGMAREAMLEYFDRRYSPSNVVLAGAGNLDWRSFVAESRQACGGWDKHEVTRDTPNAAGTRRTTAIQDAKLVRQNIGMMSPGPSAQEESRYAAHLLAAILGDSTGSRLFYALVDPAIAEEAYCTYEPFDGTGAFTTFVCAEPGRASEALEIARREYAKFAKEGPSEKELIAAKNKAASAATLMGELPMGRLVAVGFNWVYRKTYKSLAEHVARLLAVTSDEVHGLARHFDLSASTIVGLGPNELL